MEELVGLTEAAEILHLSRQRVHQLMQTHDDFPKPVGRLKAAFIWRRRDIEEWGRDTGRITN